MDRDAERAGAVVTANDDPLDLTVRELLTRIVDRAPASSVDPDPWVDAAACPVGWRHVLDAARRGELEASRIGRKVLVRRSELDRWLAAHRVEVRAAVAPAEKPPPSRVAHILEAAGYRKAP
jgi:excisionase family DNA binding protein